MTDLPKIKLIELPEGAANCIAKGFGADAPIDEFAVAIVRYGISAAVENGMALAQAVNVVLADTYPQCIAFFQ